MVEISLFVFTKLMKYYDIHTHKKTNTPIADDCIIIHNLSQSEMKGNIDTTIGNQYYSCAIHPWDVAVSNVTVEDVQHLALSNPKIVAIGECGLDKLIDTPLQAQLEVFERHIQLSETLEMPLIIHCVKAWDELLQLYKKHKPIQSWILHGYRGGVKQTEQLMKFGFYFSLGEFFNEESLKLIYPQRILLETDDSCINIQDVYNRVLLVLPFNMGEIGESVEQNVNSLFEL